MKWLFPHLEVVGEEMVSFLTNHCQTDDGKGFEAKLLCTKFTLNNVASCAFGLEGKCFEEEDNEFQQIAKLFFQPTTWQTIHFIVVTLFPFLESFFPPKFVQKRVEEKITSIVSNTLKYRETNNITRNDYLQLLYQLKRTSEDGQFTDVEVAAQAATFLGDAYETSATVMSFLLFELANNQLVQTKLREEISDGFDPNNGRISYEVLLQLPYLDAVLNEALRIHPPIGVLGKKCTKTYTYVPKVTDGLTKTLRIDPGTSIIIPLHGLHHDPNYFKEPGQFMPERFLGVNRESIKKYTFIPFGEGPRACLGQRFGILQIKLGVAYIIKNFEISVNSKTTVPIKYDPLNFLTSPVGGLWLDFHKVS